MKAELACNRDFRLDAVLSGLEPGTESESRINPMTISDSLLSDAAWLFFAAWTVMVAAVTIAAFGRDLLPWTVEVNPARPIPSPTDQVRPTRSTAL